MTGIDIDDVVDAFVLINAKQLIDDDTLVSAIEMVAPNYIDRNKLNEIMTQVKVRTEALHA